MKAEPEKPKEPQTQTESSRGQNVKTTVLVCCVIFIISVCTQHTQLHARLYVLRGSAYASSKQYQKAIDDFSKAIEVNPKLADAYDSRGTTYEYLGLYQKAIDDFSKAIELEPKDATGYLYRANAYEQLGQHDLATKDLDITKRQHLTCH